ncbi:MAG TPA: glycosyltransferase family A protein [Chitinophagaceae bacterium]|nr:glycosyltransferase family A protein [Chitinophagaceae bacterium]
MDLYFNNNPLVTVIMATFNRATYLDRSISSFLRQTFTDAELLIVDDGSVDESMVIISHFMQDHDNIRYIRHSNRRLSLSKNVGIQAAAGKYIAFLDSDDEYLPDYLERRVALMEANPAIDIIEGGAVVKGDPYVKDKNDLSKKYICQNATSAPPFLAKLLFFYNWAVSIRRSLTARTAILWKELWKKRMCSNLIIQAIFTTAIRQGLSAIVFKSNVA